MKAVRIHEHGGLEALRYEEIPEPICNDEKVKVQIKSASLNHLDIWIREGFPGMPLPLPLIMGSDGAGIISEVGKNVNDWKVGNEVVIQPNTFCGECDYCKNGKENYCKNYGIIGETENGVQSEFVVLNPINIYPKAKHLSFVDASSMQLVYLTSYQMLITRANLQPNETVLIYGATSGIGSAGIQIAKHLGTKVISTVGSDNKIEYAKQMGSDFVVNHSSENWSKQVKEIVGKKGVNVIFEHPGTATWENSMRLLAKGGRVVTCGATTGPIVKLDLRHLFMKQQTIIGSTMCDMKSFKQVMKHIENGDYKPFVDKVYPMSEIAEAHKRIEDREQIGKVVVSVE
ncbi:MAG: zinc-binding dehydrogenase [Candidatus Marinimicrobia bacterium]|nr:zinc-binding dehydrogenase [Candidatus Neomarinimicrobiota bacterium]MBL7023610.1 zinc-binding dehydrogenase [Candidatus Neomarinimicrobiota bacterium]MBL7109892.1 zinc-binding dehydrogenase [Candidatus Neomarinimicrobiota bacterium]